MPVLPDVGSTIVAPGASNPWLSAASIIESAMRSFTLPPGFSDSILPSTSAEPAGTTRASRTSGVLPIRSSTLPAIPVARASVAVDVGLDDIARTSAVVLQLPRRQVADRHAVEDFLRRFFDRVPDLVRGAALVA